MRRLQALLDELPEELSRQVFTHASWSARRSDSYIRLAFLGDSVLGLAVTAHIYPRLEADRFGAGQLSKIRAQAVSGAGCVRVAERLGLSERLRAAAPDEASNVATVIGTDRVLASVTEAVIGACFLHAGYDRTAAAVVEAFEDEIAEALRHPVDFKSALQERLARGGDVVEYRVTAELGAPHDRTFEVEAAVEEDVIATGSGRSKKAAEQAAARSALEQLGTEAH